MAEPTELSHTSAQGPAEHESDKDQSKCDHNRALCLPNNVSSTFSF